MTTNHGAGDLIASKKRRRNNGPFRKWTMEEDKGVCEKLRETIVNGGKIEQPTAKVYYEKMALELNYSDVNYIKLKAKVANLKTSYLRMVDWRSKTGQGVLETSGEDSVKAYILSKCPLFDILDEIFGSRVNVHPPIIIESGTGILIQEESIDEDPLTSPGGSDGQEQRNEASTSLIETDGEANVASDIVTEVIQKPIPTRMKRKYNDGLSALAEVQKQRVEVMHQKMNSEEKWREQQYDIEQRKLDFEHTKLEKEMDIRKLELEKSERLEKFRIEQEMKLKLELAKLQVNYVIDLN